MQTSQRQILQNGEVKSMSSLEDSHANLSVSREKEGERMITVTSGRKCCELYKRYDRLGSLVRTLLESYQWYSPVKEVEMGCQDSIFGENNRKRVLLYQEYIIETICKDIEREGYSVQPIIIPACAVGAPHKRDRVWFIAKCTDTEVESIQQTGENDIHAIGFTPDAKSEQSQWSKFEQPQNSTKEQTEFGRRSCENYSEYTMREWRDFPTQSPICRGNDGFPGKLDGITFSKWREESIKAYGNAIVPQVAYEIFKAIQETYYKPKNIL